MARDALGGRAYYAGAFQAVFGTSDFPGAAKILDLPAPATDLALGYDELLYIAVNGRIRVHDVRGRREDADVQLPGFQAWRLAADPSGGVWVLDRTSKQLARLTGQLSPRALGLDVPTDAFESTETNPNPLRLTLVSESWSNNEDPVALACSPAGRVVVLYWHTDPAAPSHLEARVRLVRIGTTDPAAPTILKGIARPFSLAWISESRIAVLVPGISEAVVYQWSAGEVAPTGEIFPVPEHESGPFLHGVTLPIEYPTANGTRPLVPVSLPAFPPAATGKLLKPLDSGTADTAWHRLYVEADIPPGTGFTLWLAGSDDNDSQHITEAEWHPHHFGASRPPSPESESLFDRGPLAAWMRSPSEIPGFTGFCPNDREKDRVGHFTVLIQKSHRPVRTVRGRFLHLKFNLRGSMRATPVLHAVRAYGPRFSYQDNYLPALYREQVFGEDADRETNGEPSTPADFFGRFLGNFEGILTPLEDSIASAWRLTDPVTAPDTALDWLGGWIGAAFEPWYPADRRRERLRRSPELFGTRGTLRGLRLALDIATNGGVEGERDGRRRIVVVEDYWMRRTLATVLGVNLDREFDPLFGGPLYTGNSRVGRTLFLTEGIKREVLALFDAALPLDPKDEKAVDDFFASLAHRATVLVHETVRPDEFQLIERVAAQESPAHVVTRVRRATQDFMVGLAALLGVDTYLRPASPAKAVEVDKSNVGDGAVLLRPPSLDPRIEGTS
jgi:phage tail-like protein